MEHLLDLNARLAEVVHNALLLLCQGNPPFPRPQPPPLATSGEQVLAICRRGPYAKLPEVEGVTKKLPKVEGVTKKLPEVGEAPTRLARSCQK